MTVVLSARLGAVDLVLDVEVVLDPLELWPEFYADGRGDVPRVGRVVPPPARGLVLPLVVSGASAQEVDEFFSAVNSELRVANVLEFRVDDNGDERSVYFRTYPSAPLPAVYSLTYRTAYVAKVEVALLVEPYALSDDELVVDSTTTFPAKLDLSGMVGEFPAPLVFTFEPDGSGDDFHSLYVALLESAAFSDWLLEAEDLLDLAGGAWGAVAAGNEAGANPDASGNATEFVAAAGYEFANVPTQDFPEGPWLVLARVKCEAGGSLAVKLRVDGEDIDDEVSTDVEHWHWLEVGEAYLPTRKVRGTAVANLEVGASATTANAWVDRLAFLPLWAGFLSYHPGSGDAGSFHVEDGDVYVDDVVEFEDVLGGQPLALGGALLVVAESAAGTERTYAGSVAVSYSPRSCGVLGAPAGSGSGS